MFEKDRQRVTEELESIVAELHAEGVLREKVHWAWNVTAEQRKAESRNLKNTLVVSYENREATLRFTSVELEDTKRKQDREQLRQKLRKLLESLAGARPMGFVS